MLNDNHKRLKPRPKFDIRYNQLVSLKIYTLNTANATMHSKNNVHKKLHNDFNGIEKVEII